MLTVENLSFSYGKKKVLEDLSFELHKGEILAVMGPSGCGKSTLLSLIAGLKKPTGGRIESDHQRLGFVFQEPRLFPWLTVRENLEAVLEHPREQEAEIRAALEAVSLADSADLYPSELSGGMKSRAALARALIYGADLYLLDEPFSALDKKLKGALAEALRTRFKACNASVILVTHDPEDAERMSDRLLVLTPIAPPTND